MVDTFIGHNSYLLPPTGTLQIHLSHGQIETEYISQPHWWAWQLTCFGQWMVKEVIACHFPEEAFKRHGSSHLPFCTSAIDKKGPFPCRPTCFILSPRINMHKTEVLIPTHRHKCKNSCFKPLNLEVAYYAALPW